MQVIKYVLLATMEAYGATKKIQNSGKTCKKDKQVNLKVKKNGLTCQKAKKNYGCFALIIQLWKSEKSTKSIKG